MSLVEGERIAEGHTCQDRSHESPVRVTYLCQTKVTYHAGARLVVEQKIRRLDISVDDAASVNVLEPLEEVKHVHLDMRRVHVAIEVLDDMLATKTSARRPHETPTRKSSDR
jgi:hypothetical protein